MSKQWHGGKGSERRPSQVSEQHVADEWARIFGQSGPKREKDSHGTADKQYTR